MLAKYEMIPIDIIELDIRNPRIAKWIEMYGSDITAEQMALALGASSSGELESAGPSFSSLKQSIMTNGGIIHPIIVNRENNGRVVVIEGNTRVLIYRELRENNAEGNWDFVPAMVYESMDAKLIDAIRLQAHLVGTRAWDPYSKAKYLDYLSNREHLTFSQIVDFCGGNTREVEDYIAAYNDMEKYYRPVVGNDSEFDPTRFSAFVELQKHRIKEAIIGTGFNREDFSRWVHDKKIFPLNTVRMLPRILQNTRSREIFLEYGAQEAIRVLDTATTGAVINEATFEQLLRETIKRVNALQYSDVQRMRNEPNSEDVDILIQAKDALVELCKDVSPEDNT